MHNKLVKIKQSLNSQNLDAILISSIPNITYLTGFPNFSKDEREAFLLLTNDKQYIFTDGRYTEEVAKLVPDFTLVEVSFARPSRKAIREIVEEEKLTTIGFEEKNLSVSEHESLAKEVKGLQPTKDLVEKLRSIKTSNEIKAIEKACVLGDKTFEHVITYIKRGVTEKELALEIEYFIKKQGADISFAPITAFGENTSVPHHRPGERKLKKGDFVLLDFGARVDNYCSDMTRTIVFGKASDQQKRIHQTVLTAQQKALDYLQSSIFNLQSEGKPIKTSEVDSVARTYITSKGYPSIPHSLGHGIGIEVHEAPFLSPPSKSLLKDGMVFSIEPGIYLPGEGGVRIEDLVTITKETASLITKSDRSLLQL